MADDADAAPVTAPDGVSLVHDVELPPGWFAAREVESGDIYYFNDNTGETRWERPALDASSPRADADDSDAGAAAPAEAAAGDTVEVTDDLPGPWSAIRTSGGEVYYWNTETGETSWELPDLSAYHYDPDTDSPTFKPLSGDLPGRPLRPQLVGLALELSRSRDVDDVLSTMRSMPDDARVQAAGMVALKAVAHKSSAGKSSIASSEGIPVVIAAMRRHPGDVDVQEGGVTVVRSLARKQELLPTLVAAGATDVCHAAKRRFPHNENIAQRTDLTVNEMFSAGDKPCVVM